MMKDNSIVWAKRALIFLTLLIIADFTLGTILKYFYFKHEPIDFYSTRYVADYCKADFLILGSSHASHHYIAKELADSSKLTCFNAGADGYNILYYDAMLKCVLKRYTPKIVILDIRHEEFEVNQDGTDRLSALLPYYKKHPEIRSIIEHRSYFEKVKLLSQTYPFNSQIFSIISRNIHGKKNEFHADKEQGYIPLTDTIQVNNSRNKGNYFEDKPIDQYSVNTYKLFIRDCLERHIKLYIFVSPVFTQKHVDTKTIQIASALAKSFGVPFYDYSNFELLKKPIYYKDLDHLNVNGAKIYTQEVINDIIHNKKS